MRSVATIDDQVPRFASAVLTALGLALGPVVALGFSRFAYALLLPPMRSDLGWNYVAAGGMNTANAIGYVVGAATAAWVARHLTMRGAFIGGMVISAIALLLTAATDDYALLMVVRTIGGYTTAVTFVVGSSLAANIASGGNPARSAALLAIYFAGAGLGIVISGLIVPSILANGAGDAWQTGWLVLGVIAALAVAPSILASLKIQPPAGRAAATMSAGELVQMLPTFTAYAIFGAGYVSYMTFIIALLKEQSVNPMVVTLFWVILGTASAISTLGWGPLLGRQKGGRGMALVSFVAAIGVLPVLLFPSATSAILSAIIFGGSFMAGPTAVTVLARKVLPPPVWTAGISFLTVAFAVGQAVGPLVSGKISDSSGTIVSGFWISPLLLVVAAAVALAQRTEHSNN